MGDNRRVFRVRRPCNQIEKKLFLSQDVPQADGHRVQTRPGMAIKRRAMIENQFQKPFFLRVLELCAWEDLAECSKKDEPSSVI
jgi:hypothetical protein